MRDIKFRLRLKLKHNWGTMIAGEVMYLYVPLLKESNGLAYFPVEKDRWEILSCDQYTGAMDINEKDIYEGDVVKWNKRCFDFDAEDERNEVKMVDVISSVVYRNHGFWVQDESFGWEGEGLWNWNLIEVVGNIYDNSELLKK